MKTLRNGIFSTSFSIGMKPLQTLEKLQTKADSRFKEPVIFIY
jgi:hypothetical protein